MSAGPSVRERRMASGRSVLISCRVSSCWSHRLCSPHPSTWSWDASSW
ncbi:hypothetical protein PVAG01_02324 [Phlyctema vagabunda]|uniref:Ig-like domain-containing protein n=1 Tax=Phlyctema vagabunda TaxID=108571 RepID=A0ABR4PQC2_9HELO